MKQHWAEWQGKLDALNQRERLLIFAVAVVLVFALVQALALDPVMKMRTQNQRQKAQLEQQLAELANEKVILEAELQVGVNRDKERQRDSLQQQMDALDEQIERSVLAMIPPQKMAQVLESVLVQDNSLKLIAIENRPGVPVIDAKPAAAKSGRKISRQPVSAEDAPALYEHSFVITLEGNYPSTINYFNRLAALPWRFYWDKMVYTVEQYPKATITLTVHTVSLSEEWIGV